jgi:ribosomal protein S4
MMYPGYLLNPGDMFQVDPERVMFATGMPKPSTAVKEDDAEASEDTVEASTGENDEAKSDKEKVAGEVEGAEGTEEEEDPRQVLKNLLAQSKSILASPREKLAAKRKQDLRAFQKSIKRTLSKSRSSTILTDSLEAQWLELQNQLNISRKEPSLPSDQDSKAAIARTDATANSAQTGNTEASGDRDVKDEDEDEVSEAERTAERNKQAATGRSSAQPLSDTIDTTGLSDRDLKDLRAALELLKDNPIDPSKPYLTPWQPREYMSAFAFIPRYLEVNQNICAAVYLRHPVARPGLAEVPTPFAEGTSASAFAWYLRRR